MNIHCLTQKLFYLLFILCFPQNVYASINIEHVTRMYIRNVDNGLRVFLLDIRRSPSKEEGLMILLENKNNISSWKGGYVRNKQSL